MPDYRGFFLRHYLGERPDGGGGSQVWTDSPDIILTGTQPVRDPTVFTTDDSYARQQANTVVVNDLNYVYVRGKNTTAATLDTRLWLFYTQSNLALWPQNWKQAGIFIDDPELPRNWLDLRGVPAGRIGVGTPVFHWQADAPDKGQHFCMIAFAEEQPLSEPPRSPKPRGSIGTMEDLAVYVRSHPNMAWRNTIDVSGRGATWSETTAIAGAEEGGEFQAGLKFKDMPTDGYISFSVPGYDGESSVVFPDPPDQWFRIPKSNGSILVTLNWRAGFSSSITLRYWQGPTAPPKGANITPIIGVMSTALTGLLEDPYHGTFELERYESSRNGVSGVERMHIVGSVPYEF
jgi:hypothetical protein